MIRILALIFPSLFLVPFVALLSWERESCLFARACVRVFVFVNTREREKKEADKGRGRKGGSRVAVVTKRREASESGVGGWMQDTYR